MSAPCPASAGQALSRFFEAVEDFQQEEAMTEIQQQVVKWLATGRVGLSSNCMAMWLAFGERTEGCFCPADPDDLDRCLKLLDAAPGLRPLIPNMSVVSKDWAALAPRWDDVEASHLDEVGLGWTKARSAPKTYELMHSILRPAT